jgi:hypothetical protein
MTIKTIEDGYEIVTEYSMMFWAYDDGGFTFPCTPEGEIETPEFPEGKENLRKILSGEIPYKRKSVERYVRRFRLCGCGSGKTDYPLHDARGIFASSVCEDCEDEAKAKFRSDIFTDSDYPCDEPVEADY